MRNSVVSALGLAAVVAPQVAQAQGLALGNLETHRCDVVQFVSDTAYCDASHCDLHGDVFLTCENLKVWSDDLSIQWTEDRHFAGANAAGHVLMVEGNRVITCPTVTLDSDRVRGRIESAAVRFKEGSATDTRGFPVGRDMARFHGDIERLSRERLLLRGADFTLCDCGDDALPSWRLDAPEIDVTLRERATIWWPMVSINPTGYFMLPITPPLPPISIPMRGRVWGLLPPEIAFFNVTSPMIDVPVFIPLGDQWDITLKPGLRTDWILRRQYDGLDGWVEHRLLRPSRYGAPRLGGRLRYAPMVGLTGELSAQWTWDRKSFLAADYAKESGLDVALESAILTEAAADAENLTEGQLKAEVNRRLRDNREYSRLLALEHRVELNFLQTYDPHPSARWLTQARWLSDDRIPGDFSFGVADQFANYAPSRTQLDWRAGPVATTLSADYLLRFGNDGFDYRNTQGKELEEPQRGPALRVHMLPVRLAPHLHVDADFGFARYGAWSTAEPALLTLATAQLGTSWAHKVGPMRTKARVSGLGLWLRRPTYDDAAVFAPLLQAELSTLVAGRFAAQTHSINPYIRYHGIPGVSGNNAGGAIDTYADTLAQEPFFVVGSPASFWSGIAGVDERYALRAFHQLEAGVSQGMWAAGQYASPKLTLDLAQPVDLVGVQALPARARLSWAAPYVGSGNAWVSLAWRDRTKPVEEAGAGVSLPFGALALGFGYTLISPNAERLHRSLYELAGIPPETADAAFIHLATSSIRYQLHNLSLAYSTTTLLPIPYLDADDPQRGDNARRPYPLAHQAGAAYSSSCRCWDLGVDLSVGANPYATAEQIQESFRLLVRFSIAGYQIGQR